MSMAARSVKYAIADPLYFDTPERLADTDSWFATSKKSPPSGWAREEVGMSIALRPLDAHIPEQGWKIHISSTLTQAEDVIDIALEFCLGRRIPLKFIRSRTAALVINSKYWPRSASGKLVTLYPGDDDALTAALPELADRLRHVHGPYVLSDIRYGDGPLFVRYGAFREFWHHAENGQRIPAIRTPDGATAPDVRGVSFQLPEFVDAPAILRPFIDNPPGHAEDFSYDIERALHFSNGGGIYLARQHSTGQSVVLREARPHAGLDGLGRDAVARLRNERDVLRRLDGLTCVPRSIEHFTAWEHDFLAVEYIEGRTLLEEIVARYPLVHPQPAATDLDEYVQWVAAMSSQLERALRAIHGCGVYVADLHPSNIIVRPDGAPVLIDFECSSTSGDGAAPGMGAPGFGAPAGVTGKSADLHALRRVQLMMKLPVVALLSLAPEKESTLAAAAASHLPLDAVGTDGSATVARTLSPVANDDSVALFADAGQHWPTIRRELVAGIRSTATPSRPDQLFPGDPHRTTYGGATMGYGAAGVLFALAMADEEVPAELTQWLFHAARRPQGCVGAGFYDGSHGVAYVLDQLGRTDEALSLLSSAPAERSVGEYGLFSGQAGIGLNLLHFARRTGDDGYLQRAITLGDNVRRIVAAPSAGAVPMPAGLFHGYTGAALLCLQLHETTGRSEYLDSAEAALRRDLAACSFLPDGTFQVQSGQRRLMYLDAGSAGIAAVLSRFLARRADADLSAVLSAIHRGCSIPFVLHPGLFQGRAGLIAVLSEASGTHDDDNGLSAQVDRLGWHAIRRHDTLAFPGFGLTRLSCDLATGTAGVLAALLSVYEHASIALPFLHDFR